MGFDQAAEVSNLSDFIGAAHLRTDQVARAGAVVPA